MSAPIPLALLLDWGLWVSRTQRYVQRHIYPAGGLSHLSIVHGWCTYCCRIDGICRFTGLFLIATRSSTLPSKEGNNVHFPPPEISIHRKISKYRDTETHAMAHTVFACTALHTRFAEKRPPPRYPLLFYIKRTKKNELWRSLRYTHPLRHKLNDQSCGWASMIELAGEAESAGDGRSMAPPPCDTRFCRGLAARDHR